MHEKKIVIVDYKIGNLFSVKNALKHIGIESLISSDKNDIFNADALILPGVGSFPDAMESLINLDLVSPIRDYVASNKPFMGICLGLQLLFSESEEFTLTKGLNIIDGIVKKFPKINENRSIRVPQIAWNQIEKNKSWEKTELENVKNLEYMYFVHSFYVQPTDKTDILCTTNYNGIKYCSAIKKNNVFATQFHPEKSGEKGIEILRSFKKIYKL